jgi:hypothetical protein
MAITPVYLKLPVCASSDAILSFSRWLLSKFSFVFEG